MNFTAITQNGAGHENRQRIGTLIMTEAQTFKTSEQTACNFDAITVPEGTEAVVETNGYWVYVTLPGTITASHWVNRVFSSSESRVDENVGQDRCYHVQAYAYSAAKTIATDAAIFGVKGEVVLDEGVAVVLSHVRLSTGENHQAFGFAKAA